jgi:hypothetical protein
MGQAGTFRSSVETGDVEAAVALLHDDVEFRSPAVHRPYRGKADVAVILRHAAATFEDFRYVDEVSAGDRQVLFFRARVGDREIEGIDSLTFDASGRIRQLVVMLRPLSGLIAMAEAMGRRLQADAPPGQAEQPAVEGR